MIKCSLHCIQCKQRAKSKVNASCFLRSFRFANSNLKHLYITLCSALALQLVNVHVILSLAIFAPFITCSHLIRKHFLSRFARLWNYVHCFSTFLSSNVAALRASAYLQAASFWHSDDKLVLLPSSRECKPYHNFWLEYNCTFLLHYALRPCALYLPTSYRWLKDC